MPVERARAPAIPVTPQNAAAMLHARGIGLLEAEADHHLIQHLVAAGIRATHVPDDLDAVRAELAELIGADIRNPFDLKHNDAVRAEGRRFSRPAAE